jgi:predicted Mrr-cat superfamily restriction endonuclease
MSVWRLISYHEENLRNDVLNHYLDGSFIAIGWGMGDLKELNYPNPQAIGAAIRQVYPQLHNSHFGGPSLWNFWHEVQIGDLVILKANQRRVVVEVTGEYFFNPKGLEEFGINDYNHQRTIKLRSDLIGLALHQRLGERPINGHSPRWVMFKYPS